MARFLLVAGLVSVVAVWLARTERVVAVRVAPAATPTAPTVRPAPPGLLARIGTPLPANTEPPEATPSLAGFPTSAVKRISFSADGRVMLTSGTAPGSTRFWRNTTNPPFAGLDAEDIGLFRSPCTSPDGRWVAGGIGGRFAAWDARTGAPVFWAPDPAAEPSSDRAIGFDRNGFAWAIDSVGGRITRRLVPSGDVVQSIDGFPQVDFAAVSPNGSRVAIGGVTFAVRATDPTAEWHVVASQLRRRGPRGGRQQHAPLAFSPDGRLLVTGSSRGSYLTGSFAVWDVTERPVSVAEHSGSDSEWLTDVVFSSDGRWVAFQVETGSTQSVRVWETATLTEAFRFAPDGMTAFAFHPDCRRLVAAHADGTLTLWDRAKVEAADGLPDPPKPDDLAAALASAEPRAALAAVHAIASGEELLPALRDQFRPLDAAKAAALAAGLEDDDYEVREAATKELASQAVRAEGVIRSAAWSSSPEARSRAGRLLATFLPVRGRLSPAHLRAGRAVEGLERCASAAAKEVLAAWAADNRNTYLGTEAKAALVRLNTPR